MKVAFQPILPRMIDKIPEFLAVADAGPGPVTNRNMIFECLVDKEGTAKFTCASLLGGSKTHKE